MPNAWETEEVPCDFTTAAGYPAHILRNPVGALCGYVRIPENHPLWNVNYNSNIIPGFLDAVKARVLKGDIGKRGIMDVFMLSLRGEDEIRAGMLLDVHGSITFSGQPYKCTIPGFWYGFDCSHAGDLSPGMWGRSPDLRDNDEVYRDLAFVKAECESLAAQLHAMEGKNHD